MYESLYYSKKTLILVLFIQCIPLKTNEVQKVVNPALETTHAMVTK